MLGLPQRPRSFRIRPGIEDSIQCGCGGRGVRRRDRPPDRRVVAMGASNGTERSSIRDDRQAHRRGVAIEVGGPPSRPFAPVVHVARGRAPSRVRWRDCTRSPSAPFLRSRRRCRRVDCAAATAAAIDHTRMTSLIVRLRHLLIDLRNALFQEQTASRSLPRATQANHRESVHVRWGVGGSAPQLLLCRSCDTYDSAQRYSLVSRS